MAMNDSPRHMSLIPYPSAQGDIVLRHGNAVVTRDIHSHQLTLRDARTEAVEYGKCPYCHRPFDDDRGGFDDHGRDGRSSGSHGFVSPEYFRMLADQVPLSADSTRQPSPTRPLRALRSGESRQVSGSGPPTGAEFIGSTPAPQTRDQGIKTSSFLPGYFAKFFVEKRVLGKGGRGVVLLVEHILDGVDCGEFACKRIPVGNDHAWLEQVLVEVQLLQRLHHPNLVAYQHVWLEDAQTTKFGPSVACVFILQQYCNSGDLHEYVQHAQSSEQDERMKRRKSSVTSLVTLANELKQMSLDEIFSFFKDIVSGLDHLHSNGYIHRDLKPSNCLLHNDGHKTIVHVSDFGEVQAATAQRNSTGATGTISYCAPEVLRKERSDGTYGNFTTKSDVFSLGMILHYMCFGDLPYINADVKEEREDIDLLRAEITSWHGFQGQARRRTDLPDRLYIFLEQLLHLDPARRPNTTEILQSLKHGIEPGRRPDGKRVEVVDDSYSSGEEAHHPKPIRRDSQRLRRRLSRHDSTGQPRSPIGLGLPFSRSARASPTLDEHPRRERDIAIGSDTDSSLPDPQSSKDPLLLLPPPPSRTSPLTTISPHISSTAIVKLAIFTAKVLTLMVGCGSNAHEPKASVALLLLAALDLVMSAASWIVSAALVALHALALVTLRYTGLLCSRRMPWKQALDAMETDL